MKNLLNIFFLLMVMCSYSCTEGDNEIDEIGDQVFVFGSYNGFCQGNCTHLFKYEDGQVFRDIMDRFDSDLKFSDTPESDLVDVATRLFNEFPEFLKESDQDTYGCPGCADQSILYVSIGDGESVRAWRLDTFIQEDWPQELKDYVNLLKSELEKIIIF